MKPEQKIQKHPLAVEWDNWLASKEGVDASNPHTLGIDKARTYLENRLHRAFDAGVEAGRKVPAEKV